MNRQILIVFLLLIALLPTLSCAEEDKVFRGPWKGRVIDAETKQPIEGAAVVAVRHKSKASPAGQLTSFLEAKETLTDKNGYFIIPAYKPINIPLFREIRIPKFTIFKPGYGPFPWWQVTPKKGDLRRVFDKEGMVVELPNLKSKELRLAARRDAEPDGDIPFNKIKNLIILLDQEDKYLGIQSRGLK